MHLLSCLILGTFVTSSVGFLDSIIGQFDSNCDGTVSFGCRNSKCVPKSKRCDGHPDCADASDEEDCDLFYCKEPNYFRCLNQKCIFSGFRCDGENDCGDFSDEANCDNFKVTFESSNCSSTEWQCHDRLCIDKEFVCNGEKDCLDGSDETLGCTQNMPCDTYKCKNGHCIPNEWVCDGNDDCHDASDEQSCQNKVHPKDCTLENKHFLCADKKTCLNLTQVCDKTPNCPDQSDESSACFGNETCATHKCSHNCVQLPTGPKCLCPDGYETIDDKTCKDINECEIYGICDQKCKNTPGSYECYCADRYSLHDGNRTCRVIGGEAMLIYSSKTEIRGYFLQSQLMFPVAKDLKQVVGVSFDGHHVYWTDIYAEHESVVRSLEDGSNRELLVTSGLGSPEDLAVDWITGNIYFTDSEMMHIGVCNNLGTSCTVLINKDIHKPRGIVLHPSEGLMFWSDWGKKPQIARSKMDGSDDSVFVTGNLRWPNGLTIDYPNERLYWTDGKLMKLESIRLDGTDRRVILEGIVKHPYAVAIFEDRLYWSDWATHSIQSCDKFTGKNHHTIVKEKKEYIYGLHVYHSVLKPSIPNPCALSYCSDICLISGPVSYTCACPENKMLSSDKHTCKEVTKPQVLIVGVKDMLVRVEHQILGKHEITALPTVAKNIAALTHNPIDNTLYIADSDLKAIISVNFNNGSSRHVITEDIEKINSIDFDYLGNNLYWCDFKKETIEVYNLKTKSRKILMHDLNGEKPVSIALVSEEGAMFVAFENPSEKLYHIDRFRMDGTGRTHVIEIGLMGPVTLHYDSTLHRVFWADAGTGNIESTSAEGDDRHTFRNLHSTPVSLTSLNQDIFWSNHNSRRIYWAAKSNVKTSNKKITLDIPEGIETLHLVSTMSHRIPSHPCNINNGNCSHLCLPTDKTYKCACPIGMGLLNVTTCEKRTECTANEFHCGNSDICIAKTLRCNGRKECLLGEDEEDCVYNNSCPEDYFQCQNGQCIRRNLLCDMHFDCSDKSDELDCMDQRTHKCARDHFKCDNDVCIQDRFVCDGIRDCKDGSDEINCLSSTCADNQFRCTSGLCIPENWECDHEFDCPDLSDEHSTCAKKGCTSEQFSCDTGLCISSTLRCNGIDDCGDLSDELGCRMEKDESDCGIHEFQCTSDITLCLPLAAKCNGTSECPHHEDEAGCSDCHVDEFECDNKKCVPSYWLCDGTDDCGDRSDENVCDENQNHAAVSPTVNVVDCTGGFRCKNGACIDLHLVCNGEENCYDGSDENGACQSACQAGRNPCEHQCKPTPTGPMCLCHEGFELSGDGHTCKDILECSRDPPICSQNCKERIGGFNCSCYDGFVLRSDRVSCKSIGEPMGLLFTMNNELRLFSQSENKLDVVYKDETPRITGLDLSANDHYVYFAIEDMGSINRINLKNKTREYISNVGKPQKMSVDWITHNIYYVDSKLTKAMMVCNFKEKKCAKLFDLDTHSQISALTVDPINKYIFYTQTTWWVLNIPHSVIYKVNLDGSKRQELVKSTVGYVTGMTFDSNLKYLYYVDRHSESIHRLRYDGSDKTRIATNVSQPNGLQLFEDHLYYLTNFGYLGKCSLYGKTRNCQSHRINSYVIDMFTISQVSRQPLVNNVCENHKCPHLCVPSELGARCICENGQIVTDGDTCATEEIKAQFGVHPEEGKGTVAAWIFLPIIIAFIIIVAYYLTKRKATGKFNISMRFQNPVYGLQKNEDIQPMLRPGDHEYTNPVVESQKEFEATSKVILEKVSPLLKLDD